MQYKEEAFNKSIKTLEHHSDSLITQKNQNLTELDYIDTFFFKTNVADPFLSIDNFLDFSVFPFSKAVIA